MMKKYLQNIQIIIILMLVSRSSKTMSECRNIRNNIKKTGTEG